MIRVFFHLVKQGKYVKMKYYKMVTYEKLGRDSWALTLKCYFYIHQDFILIYLYNKLDLLEPKFKWLGKPVLFRCNTL